MPSLHNGLTSNPKLVEAFRRALGEQSQAFSGLERASESMQPVMDLWALPEWALLRGEALFSRAASIGAAGAGVFSSWELVNPAGSGILAVVLEIGELANTLQVSVDSGTALGVLATLRGVAMDTRFPQLGEVSRCALVAGNTFVAGVALPQDNIVTGTRSTRPYIIRPGNKLLCASAAANLASTATFFWTERLLLNNEQNP